MRLYWLRSVAVAGLIAGGAAFAQDSGSDPSLRQRPPEAGAPAMNRQEPGANRPEPGAQNQRETPKPDMHGSAQSGHEAQPGRTHASRTHEGQLGADQNAPEMRKPAMRKKGDVTQNRGEPNPPERNAQDQRSVQSERNDAQQPRQMQRRIPSNGQSEDATSSTQRTTQGDQNPSGNAEFDRNAGQNNGQPIRRGDNRRTTMQGNMGQGDRGSMSGGASVQGPEHARIDVQQEHRLRETFRHDTVEPEHDANFSVAVGQSVPERVHFHPLPPDIVSIVPEYRGYDYVRLPDRIVVVDPRNRRIVFVIDEGRDGREGRANFDPRARFALSPEQKRAIHSEIVRDYQGDHNPNFEVRLGERVPEAIDLEPVPEDVYADIPDMEPYRYFVIGNAVVIVEPRTREIVDVID